MSKGDLKSPRLIWIKGGLFFFIACFACGLLATKLGDWQAYLLLALTIWAFCRSYYFAFYVIEKYVDADYRFAGLIDFARYALGWQRPDDGKKER